MDSSSLPSVIHIRDPRDPPAWQHLKHTYIIFFITGNPGLIEYYHAFLTHLYAILTSSSSSSVQFQVCGRSLAGFEVDGSGPSGLGDGPPYSLQDQIEHIGRALEFHESIERRRSGRTPRFILIGHSVGSYILLEIIRRTRKRALKDAESSVRIAGGICLFPTVTHIAKSQSGRRSRWLLRRSGFALFVSILAKSLTLVLPARLLAFLISALMSFPSDAATVTSSFIKSPGGVRQALQVLLLHYPYKGTNCVRHMARDEMNTITTDAWDTEIWGAAHPSLNPWPRPILRFLFARSDHWVANETRDELIKVRGANEAGDVEEWKPKMEIDEEEGWVHGFCISNIPVAEKVKGYIDDIVGRDLERP
ncbi:hypothetical protein K469DRAFT_588844 [Zopfia rhizophila CBS 207.26]|uniref:Lipid droplet-associated hydrolase n=1 Tax=Zopfia rhizophila CBS 207.26 TaxID=1314779 RepID=A0A6A6DUG1_9PEZI|nr:hypothetical protein K469DRAFT_588844 [Zopfia rhizophila CBS 207.26]